MAEYVMHRSLPTAGPRRTIGLLVDWLRDLYQNSVFESVVAAAAEYDINLLCITGGILESPDLFWSQRNVLYEFVSPKNVDGLIITAGTMGNLIGPERLTEYLRRYRPLPLISTAYSLPDYSSVIVDNEAGMFAILEHLVCHHGCRRVAFVRGPAGNQEAERRFAVYRKVLENHGIDYDASLVYDGTFARDAGFEAGNWFLDQCTTFDALAAANDLMALGAMDAFRARGVRIPEQVAVVGFDDIEEARFSIPPLTTVRQPFRSLGREAVRLVLAQIDGLPAVEKVSLSPQLVVRRSCGCVLDTDDGARDLPTSVSPSVPQADIRRRFVASFATLSDQGVTVNDESVTTLFDTLMRELDTTAKGDFATALADVIRLSGSTDLIPWHDMLRGVFGTLGAWTATDAVRSANAQKIRRQIRWLICEMAEFLQGQERLRIGVISLALAETSKALTAAFDVETLREVLVRLLPRLEIPGCLLSLYETRRDPRGSARVRVAFHARREGFSAVEGRVFDAPDLAPPGIVFGRERSTYVVEPLFFERQHFGFVCFVVGPREGLIYEALRDQISGALKAGSLVAQVVDEAQRRQIAEKEQADKEFKIAAQIQTMILPKNLRVPGLEIAATMIPAVNVGGDYYDVLPFEGGCWIGIGDVAGHGLGAGLIMLMIQSMVAALVNQRPYLLASEVVGALNSVLYENVRSRLGRDEHTTFCLIRYHKDGSILYAGAHEEILVYRAKSGCCERLPTSGMWLGVLPDLKEVTADCTAQLEAGDVILLYTDGVVEARDVSGRCYGNERLIAEFSRVHDRSVDEIRDHVVQSVKDWMSTQQDDITLFVARYCGTESPH
jgi:DNA-binding LacI/PurR family transcriptional regulator/serine phosphatase RsbU (regulator of sigma subunit)